MLDIVALLHCLNPHLKATTVRQLSRIIGALLAMTGRVTMVGMARWGGDGGSYRTVQRFFYYGHCLACTLVGVLSAACARSHGYLRLSGR